MERGEYKRHRDDGKGSNKSCLEVEAELGVCCREVNI